MKKINLSFKRLLKFPLFIGSIIMLTTACCEKAEPDPEPESDMGKIHIDFDFKVNGIDLEFDTLMYTNEAGNDYLVYEVQYFISNLTIYKDGNATVLDGWTKEHYVDTEVPTTLGWDVYDEIIPGDYDSVSFTFGFQDADNQSFMFVNPPESNMVWPEFLGGGYHYLKLNGKWKVTSGDLRGFAFHLGRGQVYDTTQTPPIPSSFIDNSFRISMAGSDFTVVKGQRTKMIFRMHIEEWFKNPTTYDHNVWGGDIMQNQDAMEIGSMNGWNVFEYVEP